jgi:hypothetical protein
LGVRTWTDTTKRTVQPNAVTRMLSSYVSDQNVLVNSVGDPSYRMQRMMLATRISESISLIYRKKV